MHICLSSHRFTCESPRDSSTCYDRVLIDSCVCAEHNSVSLILPVPLSLFFQRESVFAKLLRDHPTVFFSGRDELDLFRQWTRLQSCHVIKEGTFPTLSQASSDANTTLDADNPKDKSTNLPTSTDENDTAVVVGDSSRENQTTSLGGDPSSFSDTELLLEETATSALSAGLEKLTEPSAAARRYRLLEQSSYHGFQSLVTETVISALTREKQRQQEHQQMLVDSKREDVLGSSRNYQSSYGSRLGPVALSMCSERPNSSGSSSRLPSMAVPSALSSEFDYRVWYFG